MDEKWLDDFKMEASKLEKGVDWKWIEWIEMVVCLKIKKITIQKTNMAMEKQHF